MLDVPVLTEVRLVRRGSKRRLILLDDEPWRTVPADVAKEAGLRVGDRGTPDEFADRIGPIEARSARDRAVRLLTYRDRSSAELMSRLDDDGYLSVVAEETVSRMRDLGLVDDDRFARSLARSLTGSKGLGRSRVEREMVMRGVDPESVAAILDEALPLEDEQRSALEQAHTFARRVGSTRERVAARLIRKGFAPRVAFSAARDACQTDIARPDEDAWDVADAPADDESF